MAIAAVLRTSPQVRLSAAGSNATGGAGTVSVTNPGARDGELIIAIQSQTGSGGGDAGMTSLSEFTQRGVTGGSAANGWMKVWWRRASNEPTQWIWNKSNQTVVTVLVLTNWDDRDGLTWAAEPTFVTGGSTTNHAHTGVTLVRTTNRLILASASNSGGTTHAGYSGGFVEHQDVAAGATNSQAVASQETGGAGFTGTLSSTSSAAQPFVTVGFAISSPPNDASALYTPSIRLPYWSTLDNTLVLYIGANSQGASADVDCLVSSVTDDAHNLWYEAATVYTGPTATLTRARGSIWYCVGAKAIKSLTATMTQIADSIAVEVLEFSGITNVTPIDGTPGSAQNGSTTALTASGTTSVAATVALAMAVNGDSGITLAATGSNAWATSRNTTSGVAEPIGVKTTSLLNPQDDVALVGAYKILSSAGAQSTGFTNSGAAGMGWCFLALKDGVVDKTNPNPRWPQIVHEIGFGADPNNPNALITYTPVTDRVTQFSCQRGRSYELARTEAGEMTLEMNNYDGALNPMNASGPYYPNLRIITPYRVRATWDGISRNLFVGYVERWPQKWDNQRGVARLIVVDGLATLAATRLVGTLGSEILADDPYAYWPLDDSRLSDQAANKSTTTTTALSIVESTLKGGTGSFGADLNLQSEESTCWDQRRHTSTVTSDAPNALYGKSLRAQMNLPQLSNGILIECWAKIPASSPQQIYTLLALKATTFSTNPEHRIVLFQIDSSSGLPSLYCLNSSGVYQGFTSSASGFNDDSWHHYVIHVTGSTARFWIDGQERGGGNVTSMPSNTIDVVEVGGEIDDWVNRGIAVGQFAHVAIFQILSVDSRRISARANAGFTGFPERTGARIARVLNYAGWHAPRAIDKGLSFLGAAGTISRQTLLAAVQDVASWENGLAHVDANGAFRFLDRASRFNQNVKWVFGDDPSAGEIPFMADAEIELDPKYVYNNIKVTRSLSKLPDGTVITGSSSAQKKDQASIAAYFNRSLDKTSGVSSISQCEAEANWLLANYSEPRSRLGKISFVPSADPTLWPIALDIELGDRVLVKRRPFGGDPWVLDCYVEQVRHAATAKEWRVEITLTPVLKSTYGAQAEWILGSSALDVDTIVGA